MSVSGSITITIACRCPVNRAIAICSAAHGSRLGGGHLKVKVHTLDIAPLRSESPVQKRSGMTHVLNEFNTFTYTPARSSAIGKSHTCLCRPSYNRYSFTDSGGMKARLSRPRCEVAQAEIRTCNLPIANPALYHTATSASDALVLRISASRRPHMFVFVVCPRIQKLCGSASARARIRRPHVSIAADARSQSASAARTRIADLI